ncbi:DMT family transporter [Paraflavitalea soli]|uniref:DMT family transporter n=1 Tax=Paraflavitalea soli TaxID=2315862 RepID=A0A3B7MMA1_9BACT|nr:DMT family transporter [Paraflavitalea soli]AXY74449.1 DMT family transporter [Paraflavitalea soli]
MTISKKELYIGIGLAVLATIIWSGNFIVARGVIKQIPPVGLAFYRWVTGSLIMLPLAWNRFREEKAILLQHKGYIFWTALTGISLFNTLVYVAGHHSPAINLALIGTTSSPVFAIILAAIFLKERVPLMRVLGLLLCLSGIVWLLSQGSWERLKAFHFSAGDGWILLGALSFAIYNIMVRRKPTGIHPLNFLFTVFATGTLIIFPFYLIELTHTNPVDWSINLVLIILYLGAGASVLAFLCWNMAIARLGAARTALFGNLIPVFSILEAVLILDEQITMVHVLSGALVIAGVVIANLKR